MYDLYSCHVTLARAKYTFLPNTFGTSLTRHNIYEVDRSARTSLQVDDFSQVPREQPAAVFDVNPGDNGTGHHIPSEKGPDLVGGLMTVDLPRYASVATLLRAHVAHTLPFSIAAPCILLFKRLFGSACNKQEQQQLLARCLHPPVFWENLVKPLTSGRPRRSDSASNPIMVAILPPA